VDQHRKEARETLSEEARKLHTELCELPTVVTELRQMLAAQHASAFEGKPEAFAQFLRYRACLRRTPAPFKL
jgi:hypothetical protein